MQCCTTGLREKNLLRQYDLLTNCIEIGLNKGIDAFDKYTLWALNAAAVSNICQHGGRFRRQPIYVGNHIPPHFNDVDGYMDEFISVIHENWDLIDDPTTLAAFTLWRINWIHPFIEGNGRTARAACYYILCLRQGRLLGGTKTVPERIRENRPAYYAALSEADRNWAEGHFDVRALAEYLANLLQLQVADID
jgi:Fic family protein